MVSNLMIKTFIHAGGAQGLQSWRHWDIINLRSSCLPLTDVCGGKVREILPEYRLGLVSKKKHMPKPSVKKKYKKFVNKNISANDKS